MDFDRIGAVGLQNGKDAPSMAIDVTNMSCRMDRQWDVPSGAICQSRRDAAITSGIEATPLRADFANLFGDDDG